MGQTKQPLISGISFVKDGLTLGYPIRESIESIASLCDEIVINVGFSNESLTQDDGTYKYLTDYFTREKFRFIKSFWDPAVDKKGEILSQQTNVALQNCRGKYCQYIQADEAVHQEDHSAILKGVELMEKKQNIEGLVFRYIHFYGNVDIQKYTRSIYRREVRLIRRLPSIKSWRDAQGFRHDNGRKLACKKINAAIYHYGWARAEKIMAKKIQKMGKFYHGQSHKSDAFEYQRIWGLKKFTGNHPKVMENWIKENRNDLNIMKLKLNTNWKEAGLILSDYFERFTGYRIGEYKNFKLI